MKYPIKQIIVIPSNEPPPQITISLQNLSLFLGIILTGSVLLSLAIKGVLSVNKISLSIERIDEKLKDYKLGSEKHLELSSINADKIREQAQEILLLKQEHIHNKDSVLMIVAQIDQKIDHNRKRLSFYIRDIQDFLKKDTQFQVRENLESHEENI